MARKSIIIYKGALNNKILIVKSSLWNSVENLTIKTSMGSQINSNWSEDQKRRLLACIWDFIFDPFLVIEQITTLFSLKDISF